MQKATEAPPQYPGALIMLAALVPFGLGYFFSYLYRAVNAVVAPDLIRDLGLSAGELGLLTSAYLLAFSLFQLPLGILLDRFGPRRVQAALVGVGGFGALAFSIGETVPLLTLARAAIGVGFAGGLMSAFKAVVLWVPEPRRALANAGVMALGALGVIVASAPMEWAVRLIGWRSAFGWLGLATLGVAALILVVVPERGEAPASSPLRAQIGDLGRIFRDPVFVALVPVLALPAGSHIALQTLWAGPWFRDVAGFDRVATGRALLVMGGAFLVGVLANGVIADRLMRRGVSLLTIYLAFLVVFLAVQVDIAFLHVLPPVLAWSAFGMTGQSAVLGFPWLSSYFGAALSGRSNTAANLLLFGSAFVLQSAVGAVIDRFPARVGGGYDPAAYSTAFGGLLALQAASVAWYLLHRGRITRAEQAMRGRTESPPPHGRAWATGPAS